MAIEIVTIPDLGGAESVEVIELCTAVGDAVEQEESLVVLESDKASMDVPSPVDGSVVKYLVSEGDTVKVGDAIAEIETANAKTPAEEPSSQQAEPEVAPAPIEEPAVEEAPVEAPVASQEATTSEQIALVPDIGSDDKVELIEVSVAVGDQVEEGETLVVLESDKATMDVPSTLSGTVKQIIAKEGDKLGTGDQVALIEVTSGVASTEAEVQAEPAPAPTPAPAPAETPVPPKQPAAAPAVNPAPVANDSAEIYAGPAVRMLSRELGVDLSQVSGTGPKGRIQKDDVNNFVKSALQSGTTSTGGAGIPQVPTIDFSQFGDIETVKLSKIQKVTADNMQRNWLNVPHVTQFDDADITDLETFRKSLKPEGEKRGIKVTPVAFLIKAAAAALAANPEFNRSLAGDGENYVQKHYINIGMAVDTPRGLVVPVIKDAYKKGIWEISADVITMATLAREGKLKPSDMQGGCFTISSLGAMGGNGFTPIVNSPEVGILGVSKSQMKPIWDGSDFQPRLMLPLGLSYDHRVINGGDAGRFMTYLVKILSDIRHMTL
ncbi:MAG: dihydrolipoyllysine-residue acetyltransferase [Cellvibrionales bacterium TMED47]|nr:dihydrolipoyllysine-residue acetyltransferase [Porticoccaceae bacterium]RPG83371.1 MAG: dihydrolipoyllysine-residue acetyltransferase [Cellvibrionales bacterium TMED47]